MTVGSIKCIHSENAPVLTRFLLMICAGKHMNILYRRAQNHSRLTEAPFLNQIWWSYMYMFKSAVVGTLFPSRVPVHLLPVGTVYWIDNLLQLQLGCKRV